MQSAESIRKMVDSVSDPSAKKVMENNYMDQTPMKTKTLSSESTQNALITFYRDAHCLEQLQLIIKVVVPELNIDMYCNVDISPEFIEPGRLKALEQDQDTAFELCEQVKDNMIMKI